MTTALAKYLTAEFAMQAATRAVEVVGGNGYTEEWPTARLFRDTMVLQVWEGPANIQALELLRVVIGDAAGDTALGTRIGATLADLPAELSALAPPLHEAATACRDAIAHLRRSPAEGPYHARRLMDLMARTLAGVLLVEEARSDLADGDRRKALVAARYVRNRLGRPPVIAAADPLLADFDKAIGYGRI